MVKTNKKKRLVLLDTHAILHRAYHALPEFSSSKGEPTGALYGLSAMLMKIIGGLKPDYIAACYDLPGPTYRHEAYKEYKATRKKTEEELAVQIERSRDIFTAFNIPIYQKPGFEADDILGTITERMKKFPDIEVIIASGDMDTLQLTEGGVAKIYTLKKGINDTVLYDEAAVEARYGFKAGLLPDYKGLRGDPSDNIIGIKGIGEKTAEILIKNFGTLEAMYKKLKKEPEAFEKAGLTPRIIGLLRDGKEEAMFSKELGTIHRNVPITFTLPQKTWKKGLNQEVVEKLFLDLEFRSLQTRFKTLFGVPAAKEEETASRLFEVPDARELKETSIALWLIDSNLTKPSLEDILHFGKTKSFAEAKEKIFAELKKRHVDKVFEDIERPLIPIVEEVEKRGVKINLGYLKELSKEYHIELAKLEKKIFAQAGLEFNINSPKQMGEVLFDKLGLSLKNHKKTGLGVKSTKESELEKLRDSHPVIAFILEYRELQKLLSTYIDNLPEMVAFDGRLHTQFLQAGTTTGRMSSQNPNLQNIPIKTELGKKIRDAFVADKGFVLVGLDYSQIELRVAAFLSGEEKLLEIFRRGGDVHAAVAARVFGVEEDKVDKEMRRRAKVINFGIIYGMGINALRQNLGTSLDEARKFYAEYFKTFPTLAVYLERTKSDAERLGYTETYFGRRRYFEGIRSRIPYVKASAERMAVNAPLQGTQADIIKIAMVRIDEYLKEHKERDDAHLLLQVHDELVYEMKEDKAEKLAHAVKHIMESVLPKEKIKGITLTANASIGENWGNMKTL